MVFYCVIVDENHKVNHQRCQINKKKVNIVFFKQITKNINFVKRRDVGNNRKKKCKKRKQREIQKGSTVFTNATRCCSREKRYILIKRKGKKQNFKFQLYKKHLNSLILTKNLKIFNLFLKSIGIKAVFECSTYCLHVKITKLVKVKNEGLSKLKNFIKINEINEIADIIIRKLIIFYLLIMGNVERNPGPTLAGNPNQKPRISNTKMDVMTYNCNGLGSLDTRRRILNKVGVIVRGGGIVMLQETHVTKNDQVTAIYKEKFEMSSYKSNSAGVLTLFSNEFTVIHNSKDEAGRKLFTLVQNNSEKYLLINVYCPNDHRASIDFMEEVYLKILTILNKHPDCYIILAGDFNCCMSASDYLNRNKSVVETELTLLIQQNNDMCDLIDSYKMKSTEPGYTWNRGDCYSRLDYIFISNSLLARISSSKVNWSYDKSDHAALVTSIKMKDEIKKGPGIIKVNTEVLKDIPTLNQIRSDIITLLSQIPIDWNGHTKLEYMKMVIRSTIAQYTGQKRKDEKVEIENLEISINDLENLKIKLLSKKDSLPQQTYDHRLNNVNVAKTILLNNLETLRSQVSKHQYLISKAK